MRLRVLVCLALVAPLAGGCKMLVAKTALRLAVGPEQAEKLDPVAQVRRQIVSGLRAPGASGQPEISPAVRPLP